MTLPATLSRITLLTVLALWPLQPVDDALHQWVVSHPDAGTHATMEGISKYSRWVLFGVLAGGLVAGPAGRAFVAELGLALVPVNLAVEGLKWTVNRPRPDGDTHRRNSSFPSSHSANAFTLAAVLSRRWRFAAIPAWLLAALVAWSRIALDRHWLSDVLGALLLALGGAWLAAWLLKRWRERSATVQTT